MHNYGGYTGQEELDLWTDSFDEFISDELLIARAVTRRDSLSSLNKRQQERVIKIRNGINPRNVEILSTDNIRESEDDANFSCSDLPVTTNISGIRYSENEDASDLLVTDINNSDVRDSQNEVNFNGSVTNISDVRDSENKALPDQFVEEKSINLSRVQTSVTSSVIDLDTEEAEPSIVEKIMHKSSSEAVLMNKIDVQAMPRLLSSSNSKPKTADVVLTGNNNSIEVKYYTPEKGKVEQGDQDRPNGSHQMKNVDRLNTDVDILQHHEAEWNEVPVDTKYRLMEVKTANSFQHSSDTVDMPNTIPSFVDIKSIGDLKHTSMHRRVSEPKNYNTNSHAWFHNHDKPQHGSISPGYKKLHAKLKAKYPAQLPPIRKMKNEAFIKEVAATKWVTRPAFVSTTKQMVIDGGDYSCSDPHQVFIKTNQHGNRRLSHDIAVNGGYLSIHRSKMKRQLFEVNPIIYCVSS